MTKVLVTGGAGFIGSHLVDELVLAGHAVRVLDSLDPAVHPSGEWPTFRNRQAEYTVGDVEDRAAMRAAVRGVDTVFHCAAQMGVERSFDAPASVMRTNVAGTAVLAEEAASAGVEHIVLSSSMGVYGEGMYTCPQHREQRGRMRSEAQLAQRQWAMPCRSCGQAMTRVPICEDDDPRPTSIYSMSKLCQEQVLEHVRASGRLDATVTALRYFNVFGTRQTLGNPYSGVGSIFKSAVLRRSSLRLFEDGKQTRDFIHVSDVVRANMLAATARYAGALNIGTGVATSVYDFAMGIANAMGVPMLAEILQVGRPGDIRDSVAEVSKATAIGFKSRMSLHDGIRDYVESPF